METASGTRLRVLVVDDDPEIFEVFRAVATLHPTIDLVGATSPEEAMVLSRETPPDAILLDHSFPTAGIVEHSDVPTRANRGMTGLEAVEFLRSAAPDAVIAIYTGDGTKSEPTDIVALHSRKGIPQISTRRIRTRAPHRLDSDPGGRESRKTGARNLDARAGRTAHCGELCHRGMDGRFEIRADAGDAVTRDDPGPGRRWQRAHQSDGIDGGGCQHHRVASLCAQRLHKRRCIARGPRNNNGLRTRCGDRLGHHLDFRSIAVAAFGPHRRRCAASR